MNPTVQVALVGIISTVVSTLGVVVVAIINKQSPIAVKPADNDAPEGYDANDAEMFQLLLRKENAIKQREQTIQQQTATIEDLMEENEELRAHRENCLREHRHDD